jgi:hypothetical protein
MKIKQANDGTALILFCHEIKLSKESLTALRLAKAKEKSHDISNHITHHQYCPGAFRRFYGA